MLRNYREVKIFGWFTHIGYKRNQFRISCFYIKHNTKVQHFNEGLAWEYEGLFWFSNAFRSYLCFNFSEWNEIAITLFEAALFDQLYFG